MGAASARSRRATSRAFSAVLVDSLSAMIASGGMPSASARCCMRGAQAGRCGAQRPPLRMRRGARPWLKRRTPCSTRATVDSLSWPLNRQPPHRTTMKGWGRTSSATKSGRASHGVSRRSPSRAAAPLIPSSARSTR